MSGTIIRQVLYMWGDAGSTSGTSPGTGALLNFTGLLRYLAAPVAVGAVMYCGYLIMFSYDPSARRKAAAALVSIIIGLVLITAVSPLVNAMIHSLG